MPERVFRCKQFSVIHRNSAMKVGTDAILLGAWASIPESGKILDIGSGTGIISLMMAQRSVCDITAIEIDADAYEESLVNFGNCLWTERISVYNCNILKFSSPKKFELIISNPPFFDNRCFDSGNKRNLARNNESLSLSSLIGIVAKLLTKTGCFCMIYPHDQLKQLLEFTTLNNLYINKLTYVIPRFGMPPVRVLVKCSFQEMFSEESEIIIEGCKRGVYTEEYIMLTKDFYLKF